MAYITERPKSGGAITYTVRWKDPETGKNESLGTESKSQAETVKRLLDANGQQFRAAAQVMEGSAQDGPTLAEHTTAHIQMITGASAYTIKRYHDTVRLHLNGTFGGLKVQAVKHDDVVRWIQHLEQKGLSPKTISNQHGLVSAAMNSALREGLIDRNPCKGVKLPKAHHAGEDHTMIELADWLAIREHMDPHYWPFFDFLVGTGLRFSEATALLAADFKLDGRPPTVRVTKAHKQGVNGVRNGARYVGPPKTRKGKRTVSLAPSTVDAVRPLVDSAGEGLVFKMKRGGELTAQAVFQRAWNPARKAAQLEKRITIHSLRHLHAAMMLNAGMEMYDLSRRLGHENIAVSVDLYSHLLPDAQWTAATIATRALEGMLAPAAVT